ncbi:DUF4760 domain-containing protein [Aliivibrio fischeri]|uniref:DUF4760 domain-containing protein n=1 Tax=Aliivibrio fischeri TaxID=668 RepID=UPI00080EB496|nr:DUF4760 domain-containing protein [Aliivibrio fischeri]OCH04157.1 DUF4760 domain-containing protein [Aliivibrio fischeri]
MIKETRLINVLFLLMLCLCMFFAGLHIGGLDILNLSVKDFLTPAVASSAAILAAIMANRTIKNNRRSEVLKNTLDALNSDLFKGKKRTDLERACSILNKQIEAQGSFKALVRLRPTTSKFVEEFRKSNEAEYELIIDCLNYIDRLCLGMGTGIYDKKLINQFLGESVFNTWWASMILIREREMRYLDDITSEPKINPDFGSPYKYLHAWVDQVTQEQKLKGVDYALVRLKTGYKRRSELRELEKCLS